MKKLSNPLGLARIIALTALTTGGVFVVGTALGDDTPPPADNPPHGHRHDNDPAWAACKKQADEQKVGPGEARHDFMRTCMKSAKASTPPPAT